MEKLQVVKIRLRNMVILPETVGRGVGRSQATAEFSLHHLQACEAQLAWHPLLLLHPFQEAVAKRVMFSPKGNKIQL